MSSEWEDKYTDKSSEISSTRESKKLDGKPKIFWYSLPKKYKGDG